MILDTLEWVRTIWPSLHHPSFKVAQLRAKKYLPWPVIYPTGEERLWKWAGGFPTCGGHCQRNWVRSHLIWSTESWAGGQDEVGTAADTMISEDSKGMLILTVSQILLKSPHMSHRERFTCRSRNWPRGTPVLHVPTHTPNTVASLCAPDSNVSGLCQKASKHAQRVGQTPGQGETTNPSVCATAAEEKGGCQ